MSRSEPDRRMRAAIYEGPGEIRIAELPVPRPGPEEVLLEVERCGICGTDLHLFLDGLGRKGSIGGHEYAGTVAAVGEAVRGWSNGDRAVGGPLPSCGRCALCVAGRPALCEHRPQVTGDGFQGGFADYVLVHQAQLHRVPNGLDLRAAALAEPLAVALHAIGRAALEPGQRALVSGAGPLGLLIVAALRAMGTGEIVVSEPRANRRERALRVGASAALAPEELQAPALPFDVPANPFHAAIETSGNPAAMETALGQLGRAGTLVLVGTGGEPPRFDHYRILLNELVVTGAFNHDGDGFERALALLASGELPVRELLEPEDVGLDDLLPAMRRLASGEIVAKVLIDPQGGRR